MDHVRCADDEALRVLEEHGITRALVARRALELGWRQGYRHVAEGGSAGGAIAMDEEQALFYSWAGTLMVRDLAPKIGRPGIWLQPHHLERIRRWADWWKRRAGIAV